MSAQSALERGRVLHATLCLDTVSVSRLGAKTYNAGTNAYDQTPSVVYTGPARIKRETAQDVVSGERQLQANRPVLVLPWTGVGAEALLPGDVVSITVSQDTGLTGKTGTIVGPNNGTTATAHRYILEELTA